MPQRKHIVVLEQVGPAAFQASAEAGGQLIVDGTPEIGGTGAGMRPMELLLSALASCSAMDVVHILRKQAQALEHLTIHVEGIRKDATPAPYEHIKLVFRAQGDLDPHKLQRAVQLGVEKYCSVGATLDPAVDIQWEAVVVPKPDPV
jgi:putative redox protein